MWDTAPIIPFLPKILTYYSSIILGLIIYQGLIISLSLPTRQAV